MVQQWPPLQRTAVPATEGEEDDGTTGINVEEARERLRREDLEFDKLEHRRKVKEKHREKRLKEKAARREASKQHTEAFYTEDPKTCPDYGRIINQRHFKRIMAMTEDSTIAIGGDSDESTCYIAPTVLKDVQVNSKVMQEEIFGPLLPILTVSGVDEAINFINKGEKPLALYIFSPDDKVIKKVIAETSSGGVLANDCLVHYSVSALPFGGVGNSGMGSYHGKFSFDNLSHLRGCLIKQLKMEGVNDMRYPPHTAKKLFWARFFILKNPDLGWLGRMTLLAIIAVVAAVVLQRYLQ